MTVDDLTRAACRGRWEHFYPEHGNQSRGTAARAKAICAGCPIRVACLNYAMEMESTTDDRRHRHGVWGGLLPDERLELAKKWKVRA